MTGQKKPTLLFSILLALYIIKVLLTDKLQWCHCEWVMTGHLWSTQLMFTNWVLDTVIFANYCKMQSITSVLIYITVLLNRLSVGKDRHRVIKLSALTKFAPYGFFFFFVLEYMFCCVFHMFLSDGYEITMFSSRVFPMKNLSWDSVIFAEAW